MSFFNIEWLFKIPFDLRGEMEYYPDVNLFKLNQNQYSIFWNQLISAKYLYTNGYQIIPTNWFMYAFQTIKGWLGFENHCNAEKISYTLDKLAYYGYTCQFVQPDFSTLTYYEISPEIHALIVQNYNNHVTEQLQRKLIQGYFRIEPYLSFNDYPRRLPANHRFGDSWGRANQFDLIPLMDPQDQSLIDELIQRLDRAPFRSFTAPFLPDSKYAKSIAQYYYYKAKNTHELSFISSLIWNDPRPDFLAKAIEYDPDIVEIDTQLFIDYYLKKEDYHNMYKLLHKIVDSKIILSNLLKIPKTERDLLVKKDTPMAAVMATYHLEKKQFHLAVKFYSNIEELSPYAAFSIAIQEKSYTQAYDLIQKHGINDRFDMSSRKSLALHLFEAAEVDYIQAKTYRDKREWSEAERLYLQSLVRKKVASDLNPTKEFLENVYTHKRLYASSLIDADIDLYRPEDSNTSNIEKAISLLKECHSRDEVEQGYHIIALSTGLMRRIDNLREKIALTDSPIDDRALIKHKNDFQPLISVFIKSLEELIALLQRTENKDLRVQLGKAHFLLADVQCFFEIDGANINGHYEMAMLTVPDNPFYIIRVIEILEHYKKTHVDYGIGLLHQRGFNMSDYIHWFDERWVKTSKIAFDIKNIHQEPLEPTQTGFTVRSSFWSAIGR